MEAATWWSLPLGRNGPNPLPLLCAAWKEPQSPCPFVVAPEAGPVKGCHDGRTSVAPTGRHLKYVSFHVLPIPVKVKLLAALSLSSKLTLPCRGLSVLHSRVCVSPPPQQVALSSGLWPLRVAEDLGCRRAPPPSCLLPSHGAQGSHRPSGRYSRMPPCPGCPGPLNCEPE